MIDLRDEQVRAAATARLAEPWRERPVIVGPAVLAGVTTTVRIFRDLGCPVLVLSTRRGAGAVPADDECTVVEIDLPPTASVTEELRSLDRIARELPTHALEAIEAFDPERRGFWAATPFVTMDEPIDGRPVGFGRWATGLALEDKLLADPIWDAAGVPRSPRRVVPVDDDALAGATAELRSDLGTVWAGDTREGFHGMGDLVRWVRDADDARTATAFFKPRCDQVRVMPFLDGVPCSIHGFVLPDGTAALRPVEIVVLRRPSDRAFFYAGLGTTWDPPDDVREEMRGVARRVGAHLGAEHAYRGAFGVDGVLTADGFRPTELNSRMSAGASLLGELDQAFFLLLQLALLNGVDPGFGAGDLERLVDLMDADRRGKVAAFANGTTVGGDDAYPLSWDGVRLARADHETGNLLSVGDTPSGCYAKVEPCAMLAAGTRLAVVNAALLAFLDQTYGTAFGDVEPAPDLSGVRR